MRVAMRTCQYVECHFAKCQSADFFCLPLCRQYHFANRVMLPRVCMLLCTSVYVYSVCVCVCVCEREREREREVDPRLSSSITVPQVISQ